ncbi:MAG: UbiA family prenyltransferase [Actinomycetes bacterium]
MSRFLALLKATHFPQALTMVLLTTVAAVLCGQSGFSLLFVVIATASGQASIGWVNDLVDLETDKKLDRKHKPAVRYLLQPENLRTPIVIALVVMVPFSFLAAGWVGGFANILAVASAQIYNLYLSRTIWSWLPYAISFALLTVFIAQSSSKWPSWQMICISACVGVIAHIFNALPDLEIDKQASLGGLVVYLGKTKSIIALAILTLALLLFLQLAFNLIG